MDITKSREEFEDWVAHQLGHTIEYIKGQRAVTTDRYYSQYIEIPYQAWKASRESVEVELPFNDIRTDEKDEIWDRAVESCADVLRTAGIRIKGESE
ncbi:hypothetical protein [Yersinia enterocolitica]